MNCRHNLLYFFYSLLKRTKNVYKKKTVMPDVGFEKIRSILSIQPTLDQHNTYRKQSIHLQCKSIEWFLYECNIGLIWEKLFITFLYSETMFVFVP